MISKNKNYQAKSGKDLTSNAAQEMRLININGIQPKKYTRNYIKTAKYNWYYLKKFSNFKCFN